MVNVRVIQKTPALSENWKPNCTLEKNYTTKGTRGERYQQRFALGTIESIIVGLEILPCDARLSIRKAQGETTVAALDGEVTVYDEETHQLISGILDTLSHHVSTCAQEHPQCSVILRYEQIIKPRQPAITR